MIKLLRVILWDEEIGRLVWDERRRLSYFTYNPEFVKKGLNISPLSAPVTGVRALAPVWGESEKIFQRLPAFVADSLPDSWGNQLFDLWRQQNHLSGRLFSVGASSNGRIFGRIVDFRSDYVKPTDCSLSISTSTLFCLSVFLHLILLVVCLHSEVFALPSCFAVAHL